MRGRRTRLMSSLILVAALDAMGVADADVRSAGGHEVQVYRYDVAPTVSLGKKAGEWSARMPFGELGVDAYLVVVRLAPGERFISARAEVRDGLFCIPRQGRGKRVAGKIAAGMAMQAALNAAPKEVRGPLSLVKTLVPLEPESAVPPPKLKPRIVLKAEDVEHHDGYVAALLLVASNPMTRLQIEDVVTRSKERKRKSRSRGTRTLALPEKGMPRGRIMSILADGEDRR